MEKNKIPCQLSVCDGRTVAEVDQEKVKEDPPKEEANRLIKENVVAELKEERSS